MTLTAALALSLCVVLYGQSLAPPTNLRLVSPLPEPAPPSDGSAHTYFNALLERSDHSRSYSLRDQAQLSQYSQKWPDRVTQDINYVWPNDPDPRRQDAAKLIIPSDGSGGWKSETNRTSIYQVRVPMPPMVPGHAYLVTWDAWYGDEWRYQTSGVMGHKAFQFDGPQWQNSAAAIWWEVNQRIQPFDEQTGLNFYPQPNDVCRVVVRHYASPLRLDTNPDNRIPDNTYWGVPVGPGVESGSTSATPTRPVSPWNIKPEKWTRYWQLIEYQMDDRTVAEYGGITNAAFAAANGFPAPKGTRMSLWAADEDRNAVQIYSRIQTTLWAPGVREFWIEFNTSENTVKAGRPNLVAYFRNVVVLKDVSYSSVSTLLQRPRR